MADLSVMGFSTTSPARTSSRSLTVGAGNVPAHSASPWLGKEDETMKTESLVACGLAIVGNATQVCTRNNGHTGIHRYLSADIDDRIAAQDRLDVAAEVRSLRVNFVQKDNGPERLVCEAEIVFASEGPLSGLKMTGFSLWRSPEGEVYITFPSRAFGSGGERRYFDYMRSTDGSAAPVKALKDWIKEEWIRAGGK